MAMKWPFRGSVAEANETEEQRKQREDQEQKDADAFFAKIGETIDSRLKPISDKVEGMETRWSKLEQDAANEDRTRRESEMSADEKEKLERAKQAAAIVLTNARITEGPVLSEVRDKFPEFENCIRDIFAATSLERKAQADYEIYCRNVVAMTVGKAALDGGLKYDQGNKRFFLEDSQGRNQEGDTYPFLESDMSWQNPRNGQVLTGRQQLEKLGIKPEEFAKSVKEGVV